MSDEFDPMHPTSGILTNYVGTVQDAWFTTDPKYNNGQTLILKLKMKTDQPDPQEPDGLKVWEEGYPCGGDWRTVDGGQTAINPKGERVTFTKQSQVGKLLGAILALQGVEERLKGSGRRDPRKASFWVGGKWRMEEKAVGKNMSTGEPVVKNLPTEFLGFEESGTQSGTQGTVPDAPASGVTTSGSNNAIDPAIAMLPLATQAQLQALARTLSHSDWVDAVLDTDGVTDHPQIVMALSDETGLYARLK